MRVFRNTDLPVPEGPSMTEISPAGSVSDTSCQIICLPNDLVSPSTTTSTPRTPLLAYRELPVKFGKHDCSPLPCVTQDTQPNEVLTERLRHLLAAHTPLADINPGEHAPCNSE